MKNRAFVKHTKKGEIITGSLIITNGEYPDGGGLYQEVPTKWSESTTTYGTKKRAFVGYTKKGDIIPGSLIITDGTYPSGPSLWNEVSINLENTTTTSTSTTTTTTINPNLLCVSNPGWSLINLDVTTYRNGDVIPQVTDPNQWKTLTTGAWCYYNNDPVMGSTYGGKLYNWYAVNDPRGLAPVGFHIPTELEWRTLVKCIDPAADSTYQGVESYIAGGVLKETGTTHWNNPNTGATNSSGFTAIAAGLRMNEFYNASFADAGGGAYFWTSTNVGTNSALSRRLKAADASVERYIVSKKSGMSVRVIAD